MQKLKSVLVERSLIAVACSLTLPAFAVAQTPASVIAQADQDQAPSGVPPDESADDGAIEEILVTGFRASVQRAQEIKRYANSVVEAITTEDLGEFTDASIADALQRVPGLNVVRTPSTFETGIGITIRGLGPQYSNTTLNGRKLLGTPGFTGDGARRFNFETLPPEVVSRVTVYKSSTASLIEPGLAGQVDIQTLRPLDYGLTEDGVFGSFSASGSFETLSDKVSPRFGGILGGKFFDETFGISVAGLYSDSRFDRYDAYTYASHPANFSIRDEQGNVTSYDDVWWPSLGHDLWAVHAEEKQRAVSAAAQWKLASGLDINLDVNYNEFTVDRNDTDVYIFPPSLNGLTADPGGIVLGGPRNGVVAFDTTQIPGAGTGGTYVSAFDLDQTNDALYAGANIAWSSEGGRLRISADYSYGSVDYFLDWFNPFIANTLLGGNSLAVDVSGRMPFIQLGGPADVSDPSSYTDLSGSLVFQNRFVGDREAVRLDFEGELSEAVVLRGGARYSETDVNFMSMSYRAATSPTSAENFLSDVQVSMPFLQQTVPQVSIEGLCTANPHFCNQSNYGRGSLSGSFPSSPDGSPDDVFDILTNRPYHVNETNLAFYGQLDVNTQLFGRDAGGNVGLRVVRITEEAKAFQGVTHKLIHQTGPVLSSDSFIVDDKNEYWVWLPSMNLILKPADDFNLRFSVARTMSLPTYSTLAPKGTLIIPEPAFPGGFADVATGFIGNTQLKPTKAWNFDITSEYYTDYGGAYVVSIFYKDVNDLIVNVLESGVNLPGHGDRLFEVRRAGNASSGYSYGAEIGTNQPFTFLPSPWDGFGVTANYTYVVSHAEFDGIESAFPGAAKHNANLTTYYENGGFSARIALSYHSKSVRELGTLEPFTRPTTQLDASLSQKIGENGELILTGSNLTEEDVSGYSAAYGFNQVYFTRPKIYSLGLRWTF